MPRRWTAIGQLFIKDEPAARGLLTTSVERHEGNLSAVAHELGVSLRHLHRILYAREMWKVVDDAREARVSRRASPRWLEETRAALR